MDRSEGGVVDTRRRREGSQRKRVSAFTRARPIRHHVAELPVVDMTEEFRAVLGHIEAGRNLFVTGRAGTGKSTLLRYLRASTTKNIAVLAPTGVAALNVEGQTIHSFFRFGTEITLDGVRSLRGADADLFRRLDLVIIDEASMVRADLFDCIEKFLRLNGRAKGEPWGGVQVVLFGDLYQLPPVVRRDEREIFEGGHYASPYFFDARSYPALDCHTCELRHVFRQRDDEFIAFLDAVRSGHADPELISWFNGRTVRDAEASTGDAMSIALVGTNAHADRMNAERLARLPGPGRRYAGVVEGEFSEREFPTSMDLQLRLSSQVMVLKNDPEGRWVNGDMGVVEELGSEWVGIRFADGTLERVVASTWDKVHFSLHESESKIVSSVVGSFAQIPLRLAWAVTIHKGQGKTFDRLSIDLGGGAFAPGQAYVALSRARTLDGVTLRRPLALSDLIVDARVDEFFNQTKQRDLFSES